MTTIDEIIPRNPTITHEKPSRFLTPEVGMGCTMCFYTDRQPYKVVSISKSGKSCTVVPLQHSIIDEPEIIPGGFAGHCVNNRSIRYHLDEVPNEQTITIRLTKKGWSYLKTPVLMGRAFYFYDYNF